MSQRIMVAIMAAIVGAGIATAQTPGSQPGPRAATATEVDLSTEPAHSIGPKTPATLRDAALANDYAAFDALVRKAKSNGEDLGAYADLYDVWSFAQSDATGAYYGAVVHDHLAARYPDYAKFIEEYRITDSRGQSFYPSAETRSFLLQQAIEGNDPIVRPATHPAVIAQTGTAGTAPAPVVKAAKVAVAPAPPVIAREAGNAPAGSGPMPIAVGKTASDDALAGDVGKVTPQPATIQARRAKAAEAEMADTANTTRGIFLIILGLIGIGVVTMTMQASASDVHVADEEERPQAPASMTTAHDAHPTQSHG